MLVKENNTTHHWTTVYLCEPSALYIDGFARVSIGGGEEILPNILWQNGGASLGLDAKQLESSRTVMAASLMAAGREKVSGVFSGRRETRSDVADEANMTFINIIKLPTRTNKKKCVHQFGCSSCQLLTFKLNLTAALCLVEWSGSVRFANVTVIML